MALLIDFLNKAFAPVSLILLITFVFGTFQYLYNKDKPAKSRLGMRLIVLSILIFLLLAGLYILFNFLYMRFAGIGISSN